MEHASWRNGESPTSREEFSQSLGAQDTDRATQSSSVDPLSLLFSESEHEGDVRRVMASG